MTSKETLTRFIRGWLPKKPSVNFQRVTQRRVYATGFIGVGFSLVLLYPLLAVLHLAGWYNNMESSLQDLLVFMIAFFPCYMLGQFVAKLLQKKWFGS